MISSAFKKIPSTFSQVIQFSLPVIHPAVNDRIVHGVTHGKPIDPQVDLLNKGICRNHRPQGHPDEVHVKGKPAESEDCYYHYHHLYHLQQKKAKGYI